VAWRYKADWVASPRAQSYQDLDNVAYDMKTWGGAVDANSQRLSNLADLGVGVAAPFAKGHFKAGSSGATAAQTGTVMFIEDHDFCYYEAASAGWSGLQLGADGEASQAGFIVPNMSFGGGAVLLFANNNRALTFWTGSSAAEKARLDSSGRFGVGTTTPEARIHAECSNVDLTRGIVSSQHGDYSASSIFIARKGRGTAASPTLVHGGDYLGSYVVEAYDGAAYQQSAWITSVATGIPAAGSVPTDLLFGTGTSTGTAAERARITSDGRFGIGTTSPLEALEVVPTVSGTYGIRVTKYAGPPAFAGWRVNGSAGSPSAILKGQGLVQLLAYGYGATGFGPYVGNVRVEATEDFTDASQPTKISLWTTPSGSTTALERAWVGSDGGFRSVNWDRGGAVYNTKAYDFTPIAIAQSLSVGSNSLTFSALPAGVTATSANLHWLWIEDDNPSKSEAVLLTAVNTGTNQVAITCAYTHTSGQWTIASATGGGKEAVQVCGDSGGGTVQFPAGTVAIRAPLIISQFGVTVRGAGKIATTLQADVLVTPVVQFGWGVPGSGAYVYRSSLRDLTVSRNLSLSPSTPDPDSMGVMMCWYNYCEIENVRSINHGKLIYAGDPTNANTSLGLKILYCDFAEANDCYLELRNVVQTQVISSDFGKNGGEALKPACVIRISGPGPVYGCTDTVYVDNATVIPQPVDPSGIAFVEFLDFVMADGSVPPNGCFYFTRCNVENLTTLISTAYTTPPSGIIPISDIQIAGGRLTCYGAAIAHDAHTKLNNLGIYGAEISTGSGSTITGALVFRVIGNHLNTPLEFVGGCGIVSNNCLENTLTFTGAFTKLNCRDNIGGTVDASGATGSIICTENL
jgi:hypothetical protein